MLCLFSLLVVFVWFCVAGNSLWKRWKVAGIAMWVLSLPLTIMVFFIPFLLAEMQLTDANLMRQVELQIEKGELRLEKKIPYYMLRGPVIVQRNYKDCGLKCEDLVKNGYVSVFYETYSLNNERFGKKYFQISTVSDDLDVSVLEIDRPSYEAKWASFIVIETRNWLSPLFGFKNIYTIRHIDGVFVDVRADLATTNDQNSLFESPLSSLSQINQVYWYEVFKKLKGTVYD